MKPVIFALIAVTLYAFENVLMDQKLGRFSTTVVLTFLYPMMCLLAFSQLAYLKVTGGAIQWPSGIELIWLVLLALFLFYADFFYLGTYSRDGDLVTTTTIVALLPLVAAVVRFFVSREMPNGLQIAGCALAILAVLLSAKGSTAP
jgi:drug/metabolite transporter (DMT)-like permease